MTSGRPTPRPEGVPRSVRNERTAGEGVRFLEFVLMLQKMTWFDVLKFDHSIPSHLTHSKGQHLFGWLFVSLCRTICVSTFKPSYKRRRQYLCTSAGSVVYILTLSPF
jgi:hypothetical protein